MGYYEEKRAGSCFYNWATQMRAPSCFELRAKSQKHGGLGPPNDGPRPWFSERCNLAFRAIMPQKTHGSHDLSSLLDNYDAFLFPKSRMEVVHSSSGVSLDTVE